MGEHRPGPGQERFVNMKDIPREPLDINERCAFGRILTPRFFDLAPDIVPGETSEIALARVSPVNLRRTLFEEGKQSVGGVVWNSQEYTAMARSVEAIGKSVTANTLQARQLDPNIDRRNEAAQRAMQHSLFGDKDYRKYYEKMWGMVETYKSERESLIRIRRESNTPGWAHMKAGEMLTLATSAWQISFENHILRAASEHNEWGKDEHKEVVGAMRYELFYAPQDTKREYWRTMFDLGIDYNHAKTALLKHRMRQIERKIG